MVIRWLDRSRRFGAFRRQPGPRKSAADSSSPNRSSSGASEGSGGFNPLPPAGSGSGFPVILRRLRRSRSFQFAVRAFPGGDFFQERTVSVFPDIVHGLPVSLIFMTGLCVKVLNLFAGGEFGTIAAGRKALPDAAHFDVASGFANVPLSIRISDMASPADFVFIGDTRPANGAATPDSQ
jgi:hypothetical protein